MQSCPVKAVGTGRLDAASASSTPGVDVTPGYVMAGHDEETFESVDAGASLTFPMAAGSIRKNGFIVIKGRPCKVVEVSTSKTGKHGHAKCHFVAVDIFTGKKYEDLTPSSHNCEVPNITRTEYTVLDINDEGFVRMQGNGGITGGAVHRGTEELDKVAEQIKEYNSEGREMVVTILKSMNIECINAVKITNE